MRNKDQQINSCQKFSFGLLLAVAVPASPGCKVFILDIFIVIVIITLDFPHSSSSNSQVPRGSCELGNLTTFSVKSQHLSTVLQKLPGLQVDPVPLALQVVQQPVQLVQLPEIYFI